MSVVQAGLHLESYLEIRQALGLRVDGQRRRLTDFLEFASHRGSDGPIRADWAVEWACTGYAGYQRSSQALNFGPRLLELSPRFHARNGGAQPRFAGRRSTPQTIPVLSPTSATVIGQSREHAPAGFIASPRAPRAVGVTCQHRLARGRSASVAHE